ncbi:MAG: response regulator, partial [Chloroflexi bacterium]|nr:response regulator [Chloroflexota bacterium]
IHDAQYTLSEYPAKLGWGHSPAEYAVDLALVAGVKRLLLFHHDPGRADEAVDELVALCRSRVSAAGVKLHVQGATEGAELLLTEDGARVALDRPEPPAPRLPHTARVLVAGCDLGTGPGLDQTLRADGYEVTCAVSGAEAISLASERHFDLILFQAQVLEGNGREVYATLQAHQGLLDTPIVLLVTEEDAEQLVANGTANPADYILMPFTMTQLRARVRAHLTRAAQAAPARRQWEGDPEPADGTARSDVVGTSLD